MGQQERIMHPSAIRLARPLINAAHMGFWMDEMVWHDAHELEHWFPEHLNNMRPIFDLLRKDLSKEAKRTSQIMVILQNNLAFVTEVLRKKYHFEFTKYASEESKLATCLYYLLTGFAPSGSVGLHKGAFFLHLKTNHQDIQVLRHPKKYEFRNGSVIRKKSNIKYADAGGFFSSSQKIQSKTDKKMHYFTLVVSNISDIEGGIEKHERGHFIYRLFSDALQLMQPLDQNRKLIRRLVRQFSQAAQNVKNHPEVAKKIEKLQICAEALLPVMYHLAKNELFADFYAQKTFMMHFPNLKEVDSPGYVSLYDYWAHLLRDLRVYSSPNVRNAIQTIKIRFHDVMSQAVGVAEFVHQDFSDPQNESPLREEKNALFWAIIVHYPIDRWAQAMRVFYPQEYTRYKSLQNSHAEFMQYKASIIHQIEEINDQMRNQPFIYFDSIPEELIVSPGIEFIQRELGEIERIVVTSRSGISRGDVRFWQGIVSISKENIQEKLRRITLALETKNHLDAAYISEPILLSHRDH